MRDIGLHRGEISRLVDGLVAAQTTVPARLDTIAASSDRKLPRPAGWAESCNT